MTNPGPGNNSNKHRRHARERERDQVPAFAPIARPPSSPDPTQSTVRICASSPKQFWETRPPNHGAWLPTPPHSSNANHTLPAKRSPPPHIAAAPALRPRSVQRPCSMAAPLASSSVLRLHTRRRGGPQPASPSWRVYIRVRSPALLLPSSSSSSSFCFLFFLPLLTPVLAENLTLPSPFDFPHTHSPADQISFSSICLPCSLPATLPVTVPAIIYGR